MNLLCKMGIHDWEVFAPNIKLCLKCGEIIIDKTIYKYVVKDMVFEGDFVIGNNSQEYKNWLENAQ